MSEQSYFTINAGRAKRGTPVLDSQPGAHTGATRKYIPGYSDSNIVFLNTSTGNDGNTGASIAQALLTYSAAATAAGSDKKIRLVNSATLSDNITKPTEATIGTTSSIASSSLTATVDTWTQAATPSFSTSIVTCGVWAQKLSRFVAGGADGKIAYSSDGDTWTQAGTPSFSTDTIFCIVYSSTKSLLVSGGGSGKIAYSSDGNTWTQASIRYTSNTNVNGVAFSPSIGVFVAVTNNEIVYSTDGDIWSLAQTIGVTGSAVCWSEELELFVSVGGSGAIYYSSNGVTWDTAATPSFSTSTIYAVTWCNAISKFIAAGESGKIAYSADGDIWTQAATPSFSTSDIKGVAWADEISRAIATSESGKIAYSSDGDTWTQAGTPSFGVSNVRGCAYSPLLGKLIAFGSSGKIACSTAYATTISAAVAGFSIQAVQYSGTITAYNCTLKQPGTTAALSLDSCRVTESGSHISNNSRSSSGTLYEGDRHTTGAPAAQNDISMTRDTVTGTWYNYNSSVTGYEQVQDNIIEGGIVSTYAINVTSGNTRGTSSGCVFSADCTQSDPKFVDTTDYKLQREMDSYQYDSPMVAASLYYFNTNGDARDIGAWSYNESDMELIYTRHFPFLLPRGTDAYSVTLHTQVNRHVGADGTPDVTNDVDSIWEEITLSYQTLPTDHIDFLDWWQLNFSDMTCELDFFVNSTVSTTVTVSGTQAAGIPTLTIDAGSTLAAGDRIAIGTEYYSVLYMVGDTIAVLSKVLVVGVTDNDVLTVSQPTGLGTYQYFPQSDRNLRKPMARASSEFDKGLVLNFSRKRT